MPAEIAFGRVAETTSSSNAGSFYRIVNQNIHEAGMLGRKFEDEGL